jgi:hypothetical protein
MSYLPSARAPLTAAEQEFARRSKLEIVPARHRVSDAHYIDGTVVSLALRSLEQHICREIEGEDNYRWCCLSSQPELLPGGAGGTPRSRRFQPHQRQKHDRALEKSSVRRVEASSRLTAVVSVPGLGCGTRRRAQACGGERLLKALME